MLWLAGFGEGGVVSQEGKSPLSGVNPCRVGAMGPGRGGYDGDGGWVQGPRSQPAGAL